jgi:hypothetical protein
MGKTAGDKQNDQNVRNSAQKTRETHHGRSEGMNFLSAWGELRWSSTNPREAVDSCRKM